MFVVGWAGLGGGWLRLGARRLGFEVVGSRTSCRLRVAVVSRGSASTCGVWGACGGGGPTRRLKSEGRSVDFLVCGRRDRRPEGCGEAQIRISFSIRWSLWATDCVKKNVPRPALLLRPAADHGNLAGLQREARGQLADSVFFLAIVDLEFLWADRGRVGNGLEGPLIGPIVDLGNQPKRHVVGASCWAVARK